ncbi:MAG: DMT family transporter [Proteobacteria bacterium]|nr:DMT family transporter [Pseudomonadota bacterium]
MNRAVHVTAAAALTMACASLTFASLDACSKYLSRSFPAPFIVWIRYCMQALVLTLVLAPRMRLQLVRTRSFGLQVLRGLMLVLSSTLVVMGFRYLPLAEATSLSFAAPTLVTVLAIVMLHEHVTPARAVCVAAGFAGVLLIARPGSSIFQPAALFPLAAALAVALYQILTRKLAHEDARTMLFYTAIVGAATTTAMVPWVDAPPIVRWQDMLAIGLVGLFATVGHFLFIRALQLAPASGLASISYVQLVFATALGWFVYDEFPDRVALVGMTIIAGAGLFLTWYERRRAIVPVTEPAAVD